MFTNTSSQKLHKIKFKYRESVLLFFVSVLFSKYARCTVNNNNKGTELPLNTEENIGFSQNNSCDIRHRVGLNYY